MRLRASLGLAASGGALAVAIVACSSFTAAEPGSAPDGAADAPSGTDGAAQPDVGSPDLDPGCVRSTFAVGDAGGDTALAPLVAGDGRVGRGDGGLVFSAPTGAPGQQAYGAHAILDRHSITRLVVSGRITVDEVVPNRPWSPIAIFASDVESGAERFTGTVLVTLGDGVGERANTSFAPPGEVPTIPLSSGMIGSFPSRVPFAFRLDVIGRWHEGLDVSLASNDYPSLPEVPAPRPKVAMVPDAGSSLDVTIGIVYAPEAGATVTLHELRIEVCRGE